MRHRKVTKVFTSLALVSVSLVINTVIFGILCAKLLLEQIELANSEQYIRNEEVFKDESDVKVVIAIQVHNRSEYLRELVHSLSKAKHMESALLVFSHDVFSEELNVMVQSIEFARVLQIFYPYSVQAYPDSYPGTDPDDCGRNETRKDAFLNCSNADYPDQFGHFREAKYTQIKHHWWWKASFIFYHLRVARNFDGPVLFLEEDHLVSADFIHVLLLAESERLRRRETDCCDVVCLGTYTKGGINKGLFDKAEVTQWRSTKHNMGMAFTRDLWNKIRDGCAEAFCNYDDYNWDWSLQHVSMQCLIREMAVLLMKAPRVFHIGECGTHHSSNKVCNATTAALGISERVGPHSEHMFPKELVLSEHPQRPIPRGPRANGGWADPRDRRLCLAMAKGETIDLRDFKLPVEKAIINVEH